MHSSIEKDTQDQKALYMLTTRVQPPSRIHLEWRSFLPITSVTHKKVAIDSLIKQQKKRLVIDAFICTGLALGASYVLFISGGFSYLSILAQQLAIPHAGEILPGSLPISFAALLFGLLRWREQTALVKYIHGINHIDHFTGIANRQGMEAFLNDELQRSSRYQTALSVLLIDLDDLHSINDLYGRQVGDRIIQHIAHLLSQQIRGPDKVGRLDGEEFMIVLPETSLAQAELVAERIRQYILENPLTDDGETILVSVSIGVTDGSSTEPDQLLYHADQALTTAKQQGKNQVQRWQAH